MPYPLAYLDPSSVAALTSPRTAEPGPGGWIVKDPDSRLTIAADQLQVATTVNTVMDRTTLLSTTPQARKKGRMIEFVAKPTALGEMRLGLARNASALVDNLELAIALTASGGLGVQDGPLLVSPLATYSAGVPYVFRIYDHEEGLRAYYKVSGAANWTVLWHRTPSQSPLLPLYAALNFGKIAASIDSVHVRDVPTTPPLFFCHLPTPGVIWNSGLTAALYEVDFTADTTDKAEFWFRFQDANNYWRAWLEPLGTFNLTKRIAGADTSFAATAFSFTPGQVYTLRVLLIGNQVRTFLSLTPGPAANDSALATATQFGVAPIVNSRWTAANLICNQGGALEGL